MPDSRFFNNHGPFSLKQIAEWAGCTLPQGTKEMSLCDVAPLDLATREQLSFLDNPKYAAALERTSAGACLVAPKFAARCPEGTIALVCDEPYRAYASIAAQFYPTEAPEGISPQAVLHPSAKIGEGTSIGPGVVIGAEVVIGAQCRIGANCVITHSIIGNEVIIHPGALIGQDGFGFAMGKTHLKVPQLGRVIIQDHVEIGAGSCIDRGAGPDTIIGEGTKIDNLVQIGHNVRIGCHVVIVSQVGISGSSVIEDYAVIGGQVGVAGHLSIGKGAQIAAQSGVAQHVPAGKIYGGSPAQPIRDWHRSTHTLNQLSKRKPSSSGEET